MLLILGNRFRITGFCCQSQGFYFLFPAFIGSSAFFLIFPFLLRIYGGNSFFLGHSFNRRVVAADEIKVDVDVLLAVDGAPTSCFMNFHPVDERVEHGIGQFCAVTVFSDKCQKTLRVRFLYGFLLNLAFQLLYPPFQKDLFFIVLLDHALRLSFRQYTFHGAFVQVLNHGVQLCHALSGFFQFPLSAVCVFALVFIPDAFELGNKLGFIFKGIFADRLDCL